jgi:hypothetical protein
MDSMENESRFGVVGNISNDDDDADDVVVPISGVGGDG